MMVCAFRSHNAQYWSGRRESNPRMQLGRRRSTIDVRPRNGARILLCSAALSRHHFILYHSSRKEAVRRKIAGDGDHPEYRKPTEEAPRRAGALASETADPFVEYHMRMARSVRPRRTTMNAIVENPPCSSTLPPPLASSWLRPALAITARAGPAGASPACRDSPWRAASARARRRCARRRLMAQSGWSVNRRLSSTTGIERARACTCRS